MILKRRSFLTGFASVLAAPAIVRASSLMPVTGIPAAELYVGGFSKTVIGGVEPSQLTVEIFNKLAEYLYSQPAAPDFIFVSPKIVSVDWWPHARN